MYVQFVIMQYVCQKIRGYRQTANNYTNYKLRRRLPANNYTNYKLRRQVQYGPSQKVGMFA